MLARGVVVAGKVNVEILGGLLVDQPREGEPLLMAVPLAGARDPLPESTPRAAKSVVVPWQG